jgi:hypothetical protein
VLKIGSSTFVVGKSAFSRILFPLTPALSLGERENRSPSYGKTCDGFGRTNSGKQSSGDGGSLSLRERVRVRGNRANFVFGFVATQPTINFEEAENTDSRTVIGQQSF